jgi:RimJ/RimL family protein N-acetyltransferase
MSHVVRLLCELMSRIPSGQERLPCEAVPGRAERSPRGGSAGHNLLQVRLRALPLDEALALLDGTGSPGAGLRWHEEYPMAETVEALAMVDAAHRATAPAEGSGAAAGRRVPAWWLHQIVLGDLVVGDIGFHGPPAEDGPAEVEIGYDVVPALRGRGVATRAAVLIQRVAWRDGAAVLRAATERDNRASQRVLLRSGFVEEGEGRYVVERPPQDRAGEP